MTSPLNVRPSKSGTVTFDVRAKPRAKVSRIVGVREGALEVQLAAPPVDGAANEELIMTLASALGVPRRDVSLVVGASARFKRVEVRGLTVDEARSLLLPVAKT